MALLHLNSAALSDVGRMRNNNEDAVLRLPKHGVFCVADGMGGAEGGERASQAVIEALGEEFLCLGTAGSPLTCKQKSRLVRKALNRASARIREEMDAKGGGSAGSTAVVLIFDDTSSGRALSLHAGDSRLYRLRSEALAQLTRDHSVAAAINARNEKEVPAMFRGMITRAVGVKTSVHLEKTAVNVKQGDLLLLCSDGLTRMLPDKRIESVLNDCAHAGLENTARRLIDEANCAGGHDNISVALISIGVFGDDELETEDDTADTETGGREDGDGA